MEDDSPATTRKRRTGFDGSLGIGVFGLLFAVFGYPAGGFLLAGSGAAATILAVTAMILHLRLGDGPFRTHAARAKRLRAELATWAAAAPLGLACLLMIFDPSVSETTHITGKPVEVRSDSRQVFMPDGRDYIFNCGEGRSRRSDCPALARWRALPRWPEPQRVEMEVSGREIRALRMDGQIIVDRKADDRSGGTRLIFLLLGVALLGGGVLGAVHTLRRLIALTPRAGLKAAP